MLAGTNIGPFAVEKELGSGAMGSVYRVRYEKTGKRYALKIIAAGLAGSKKAMDRFEREGEILKQLKHPNIVRLFAIGRYQGTPYYAMEYIDGESLDRVMDRRGRIAWEEVVAMGQQLCAALQHAHEHGIVHRDLKPSNLMVLPDGTLKLTDFGIAKDLDVTQLTEANCTVGTASYMSPEQCKGERILTHKSDLYSLGVVFYELITGKKPFVADTPLDMFLLHVQAAFTRPARLVLDIPVWLDNLICQLLEKKPEHRPLDAARVSDALGQIKEKVEAQLSAGVEAVKTRIKDRATTDMELDALDKAAARTLLGRKKKAKKKARGAPFYSRVWFKAVVLSVMLVGLEWLIVLLNKPTPAKDLLKETKALMADDKWQEARDGPIQKFLQNYPDDTDEVAQQMRAFADDVDAREQERLLLFWIRTQRITSDDEKQAREAVQQEDNGDLTEAWKAWEPLLINKKDVSRKIRAWGLLAEKRRRDLQQVFNLSEELNAIITAAHKRDEMLQPPTDDKGRATQARHFDTFGDHVEALARWEKIRQKKDGSDPQQRKWFLLAAWQSREVARKVTKGGDESKARRDLIQSKLKEADDRKARAPDEARMIWQDIVCLYEPIAEADPEIGKLVTAAKERLKK
jgi:serine/threonine-protein kinase